MLTADLFCIRIKAEKCNCCISCGPSAHPTRQTEEAAALLHPQQILPRFTFIFITSTSLNCPVAEALQTVFIPFRRSSEKKKHVIEATVPKVDTRCQHSPEDGMTAGNNKTTMQNGSSYINPLPLGTTSLCLS